MKINQIKGYENVRDCYTIDEQGNVLDNYPVSDDARRSKSIPVGDRCSASVTYAMPTSSKTLRVIFYNMYGSPLGETIIETGL